MTNKLKVWVSPKAQQILLQEKLEDLLASPVEEQNRVAEELLCKYEADCITTMSASAVEMRRLIRRVKQDKGITMVVINEKGEKMDPKDF